MAQDKLAVSENLLAQELPKRDWHVLGGLLLAAEQRKGIYFASSISHGLVNC